MGLLRKVYLDTSVISALYDNRTPERMSLTKTAWKTLNDYDDALHVAIATVNDIRYLLSWNFKHLVKVKTRRMVSLLNTNYEYSTIEIIAPPEL